MASNIYNKAGGDQNRKSLGASSNRKLFPVVGVGASAGGLEALGEFFETLPKDSGMAYVVIQHLSPDFKSFMSEILQRGTSIPVQPAQDGMKFRVTQWVKDSILETLDSEAISGYFKNPIRRSPSSASTKTTS